MKSSYDAIAWVYRKHWGPFSVRRFMPVLERLLLPRLPAGAHILDLGCGPGNLARALWEKGYQVTGIDASAEMVHEAREVAPNATFFQQDMRAFYREDTFHAAIALFATMNHLLTKEDLRQVLDNVKRSLVPGGWFIFDFNTPGGLQKRWQGVEAVVEPEMVVVSQGRFDQKENIAETAMTVFRLDGATWLRSDTIIKLRGYEEKTVEELLKAAGFARTTMHRITGKTGQGRVFALCHKPD